MARPKAQLLTEPAASQPTIVLVGGGSGGHITPQLAVGEEIKKLRPKAKLVFIGQKGEKLVKAVKKNPQVSRVYTVRAGKFRRYHGSGLKQAFDLKTLALNIRDFFYVLMGLVQAFRLLGRIKPDVVFIKGGFVGVPVGLAAAMRHIPYVTHDSDALPGLANRIVAHWAIAHAVALPKEVYKYPSDKTFSVGVPISSKFLPVDEQLQNKYKQKLGLKPSSQVLFITGGGNGAQRLNEAVIKAVSVLLPDSPNLFVFHITGIDRLMETNQLYYSLLAKEDLIRVKTFGFIVGDLYMHSGAADIVVTRAGATNLAEFAAQHKACIIVPNPLLTGGHQLKNADYLAKQKAAVLINDNEISNQSKVLVSSIKRLLDNKVQRRNLGEALGQFARPRAAKELAELLIEVGEQAS